MRKLILIIFLAIVCITSIGAERNEPRQETIDFEQAGFVKMYATAYCVGHHTANGSAVHEGGCASSIDHIGDVAIVYTLDGEFLAYLECNDTGREGGGVRAGNVLDIYKSDMESCQELMELLGKEQKVWIRWIEGDG